jgi:hypothetical protein
VERIRTFKKKARGSSFGKDGQIYPEDHRHLRNKMPEWYVFFFFIALFLYFIAESFLGICNASDRSPFDAPIFRLCMLLYTLLYDELLMALQDTLQPPALVTLVLPHLPPQLSTTVVSGLRYLQMGSMLLDDIAWVLLILGFLVYIATWVAS